MCTRGGWLRLLMYWGSVCVGVSGSSLRLRGCQGWVGFTTFPRKMGKLVLSSLRMTRKGLLNLEMGCGDHTSSGYVLSVIKASPSSRGTIFSVLTTCSSVVSTALCTAYRAENRVEGRAWIRPVGTRQLTCCAPTPGFTPGLSLCLRPLLASLLILHSSCQSPRLYPQPQQELMASASPGTSAGLLVW